MAEGIVVIDTHWFVMERGNKVGKTTQFWVEKVHLPGTTSGLTMKLTQLTMTNMQLGR